MNLYWKRLIGIHHKTELTAIFLLEAATEKTYIQSCVLLKQKIHRNFGCWIIYSNYNWRSFFHHHVISTNKSCEWWNAWQKYLLLIAWNQIPEHYQIRDFSCWWHKFMLRRWWLFSGLCQIKLVFTILKKKMISFKLRCPIMVFDPPMLMMVLIRMNKSSVLDIRYQQGFMASQQINLQFKLSKTPQQLLLVRLYF